MSFDLAAVIRPEVRAQVPYHAGPEPTPGRRVKLDANESPFALGEALRGNLAAEFARALADVELHRYPDPTAQELREILARDLGVSAERLLIANGSDEAIQLLQMAVAGPGAAIAIPVPTFVMYAIGAQGMGIRVAEVPLDETFALDAPRFLATVRKERPRLVFLAWPNNPTGNLFEPSAVEAILRACAGRDCQSLVVVDEAYCHYSGQSFLSRLGEFPNLVILRTLSKIGLAGIRLGILVADAAVVREVNKIRMPYNVNALSQAAARVVLTHGDVVAEHAAAIVAERDRVFFRAGLGARQPGHDPVEVAQQVGAVGVQATQPLAIDGGGARRLRFLHLGCEHRSGKATDVGRVDRGRRDGKRAGRGRGRGQDRDQLLAQ
ncbi:MAG: aminotransferase class I/II-fold pyridoxal phosphate-dependent enzyme, partial [Zetaproteobacteria bacterium]